MRFKMIFPADLFHSKIMKMIKYVTRQKNRKKFILCRTNFINCLHDFSKNYTSTEILEELISKITMIIK